MTYVIIINTILKAIHEPKIEEKKWCHQPTFNLDLLEIVHNLNQNEWYWNVIKNMCTQNSVLVSNWCVFVNGIFQWSHWYSWTQCVLVRRLIGIDINRQVLHSVPFTWVDAIFISTPLYYEMRQHLVRGGCYFLCVVVYFIFRK